MGIFDKLKSAIAASKQPEPVKLPETVNQPEPQKAPVLSYAEQEERYKQNRMAAFREELAKLRAVEIKLSSEPHNRNQALHFSELIPKNITKSTSLAKLRDFVALDVETTGIKTGGTDIIEVSAIRFHDFEPAELFTTLIRPRKPIPPEASAVNNITDEMVQNAPKFCEIVPALTDFLGKLPIVAHNAEFDLKHLYVNGLDAADERSAVYDTLQLSKKFCDKDIIDHKLATVCREYNIVIDGAHRATADALACGLVFVKMLIQARDDCCSISDLLKASQP